MTLFADSFSRAAGGQIALAAVLAIAGFSLLLPRPRQSLRWAGIALIVAAGAVFGVYVHGAFGSPMPDLLGSVLFWLFSAGAIGFGTVMVVQRNPARGAIAFAFVILSTCGLFLLLAAPFLMAATVIIYAGAVIVTFLFVLMLSQPRGESNENDRSREPLFGALAGFAFVGLVLFAGYLTALGNGEVSGQPEATEAKQHRLPAPELTARERRELHEVITRLDSAPERLNAQPVDVEAQLAYFSAVKADIARVVGSGAKETIDNVDGSLRERLEKSSGKAGRGAVLYREDQQTRNVLTFASGVRSLNWEAYHDLELVLVDRKGKLEDVEAKYRHLREEVVLLAGAVELPARNVENLGYVLYADQLLAIELAGTLLLVATIGAVAIAHRKIDPGVAA